MRVLDWNNVRALAKEGGVELVELLNSSVRSALFSGYENIGGQRTRVFVQVFDASGAEADEMVLRFQEVAYLQHPHIVRILRTGRDPANGFVYVTCEAADRTLGQISRKRPIDPGAARVLTEQIVAALEYLHSENLVFCNLRPSSIWLQSDHWKLADFSQLRLSGRSDPKQLRSALARQSDMPPEAFEGVVSPAWDSWGIGTLLRALLAPETNQAPGPQRGRQLREVQLPAPFDSITSDCLEPDPAKRLPLGEIKRRLAEETSDSPTPQPKPERRPPYVLLDPPRTNWWSRFRRDPSSRGMLWALGIALGILGLVIAADRSAPGDPTPSHQEVNRIQVASARDEAREADREKTPANPVPPSADQPDPGIQNLLTKWVDSTRDKNLAEQASCYAPVVNVFYGQYHVTRNELQRLKHQQFDQIGPVHRFNLKNVQITRLNPDTAVVLFDKDWDFGDQSKFAGSERAQLTLNKIDGDWKIAAERELRVYWVKRPGGQASRLQTS